MNAAQLVISVEHASREVPAALRHLGLPPAWFLTHHGWDPGTREVGRILAAALGAPLHLGRWSRLVADLNRSSFHPRVVPRNSGGRRIPGNAELDPAARRARLARYWRPYREAVERDLDEVIARHGTVLHLSLHSFVERLGAQVRRNHFGLLYQPSRRAERSMADRWAVRLQEDGYSVRRNYPYSGEADGFCMRMRAQRPARQYLGMEIEMNQRWARTRAGARRFAKALLGALEAEFGGGVAGDS